MLRRQKNAVSQSMNPSACTLTAPRNLTKWGSKDEVPGRHLQKEAVSSPCNFAATHWTAFILHVYLLCNFATHEMEEPFATPNGLCHSFHFHNLITGNHYFRTIWGTTVTVSGGLQIIFRYSYSFWLCEYQFEPQSPPQKKMKKIQQHVEKITKSSGRPGTTLGFSPPLDAREPLTRGIPQSRNS